MYLNRAKRKIASFHLRSICDALCQLFFLAMAGHAGAIQINFGVTPLVLRISRGQAAALVKGRRACRADLNVSSRASDGNQGQPKTASVARKEKPRGVLDPDQLHHALRNPERRRLYERARKATQRRRARGAIPVNAPDSIKAKGAKFGECTFRACFSPALFTSSLFAAFAQFRELLLFGHSIGSPQGIVLIPHSQDRGNVS